MHYTYVLLGDDSVSRNKLEQHWPLEAAVKRRQWMRSAAKLILTGICAGAIVVALVSAAAVAIPPQGVVRRSLLAAVEAQAPPVSADSHPVVESYYRILPGKTEEWLELYRTQHLPILKQRQRDGQILSIVMYRPFLHQGEPYWDFKVILTYRDFAALGDRAGFEAVERKLYPNWEAHQRAEQRRWEVTAKHWDDFQVAQPIE